MISLNLSSGDCVAIGDDITLQIFKEPGGYFRVVVTAPEGALIEPDGSVTTERGMEEEDSFPDSQEYRKITGLRALAKEIAEYVPGPDAEERRDMIGVFVTELMMSVAERGMREERSRRQREAIDAAQSRGVRFGRKARALPDNFSEARIAWRSGEMSLKKAAETCGMAKSTFYEAVLRSEKNPENAV